MASNFSGSPMSRSSAASSACSAPTRPLPEMVSSSTVRPLISAAS